MENNKKNTKLYVLITILCIFVLGLGGYIIFDKVQNNNKTNIQAENETTKNGAIENNTNNNVNAENNSNSNTLVSKIDTSEDWIYDATYTKNVNANSYSTFYHTYYSNDIKVPFINVDSSYASVSNEEIKGVFENAIATYNKGVSDKQTYVDTCNYEKYIDDSNLSILLSYKTGATDIPKAEYYAYNINLKTGNKLSYEEVYKIAGLTSDNITSKVESAIKNKMNSFAQNLSSSELNTYTNQSIENYKNSVNDGTLKYFLSGDKKLSVVVTLNVPAGSGKSTTVITIE